MKAIEKAEKNAEISEDEKFTQKEAVQTVVETSNRELELLFTKKEQELKK